MRVGLIDVDGHNFPSLPLMKLSAWHKQQGDNVEWYNPLTAWINPPDKGYMSKVFTLTPDYQHPGCGGEIIKGGTGYNYPSGGDPLPPEFVQEYGIWLFNKRMPTWMRLLHCGKERGQMCSKGCGFVGILEWAEKHSTAGSKYVCL